MANMSYCRFQNTFLDLRDCVDVIGEAVEEGKTFAELLEELGTEEEYALKRMLTYCQDFIDNVNLLQEAQAQEEY